MDVDGAHTLQAVWKGYGVAPHGDQPCLVVDLEEFRLFHCGVWNGV